MTDDQQLLASAYLDGGLDAAERARAEADPAVMAEVELLRAVREELRRVDAPDAARRDQAIAAALAALDRRPPAPTAPVRLPGRDRRMWSRVLAAAAAAVVVVSLGVAVAQVGPSGGDDDAASGDVGPAEQATMSAGSDEATRAAPAAADAQPGATAGAEEDTAAATEGTEAAGSGGSAGSADDGETTSETRRPAPAIESPRDLVDLAERLEPAPAPDLSPAGCADPGRYLGPATYRGTPVEVFADDATVTALDAETCAVVESVER